MCCSIHVRCDPFRVISSAGDYITAHGTRGDCSSFYICRDCHVLQCSEGVSARSFVDDLKKKDEALDIVERVIMQIHDEEFLDIPVRCFKE